MTFRSKRGDMLKMLAWEGTGLVLTYKRIEERRFAWPGIEDGVMRLSKGPFEALFEGLDWHRVRARPVRPPLAAESSAAEIIWWRGDGDSLHIGAMPGPIPIPPASDRPPPAVVSAALAAMERERGARRAGGGACGAA